MQTPYQKQPFEMLSNYMDNLTVKEYLETSKTLREKLGWDRTQLSNRKTGKVKLTPADQIAITTVLKVDVFNYENLIS